MHDNCLTQPGKKCVYGMQEDEMEDNISKGYSYNKKKTLGMHVAEKSGYDMLKKY